MASRAIEVILLGNARQLNKELSGAAARSQSSFGKIQKAAKYTGLAIAGGLGIAAKIGFDELQEGLKVGAQTSAVLKSTGGVANVTAGHVDTLAQSLLKKSGVDDEQIKSGENLLLTFTHIRNEVGKGNDIFDQATRVSLDLSKAMGKDMTSSSRLVGKALNDPVKGLTALSRVGITFTDAQKKMITGMVDSGHTAKAQQYILAQLNKRVGGSAEAYGKTLPGQVDIAKESFKNLAADMVKTLLPAFLSVIGVVGDLVGFLSAHESTTKVLVVGLAALAAVLGIVSVATSVYSAATKIAAAGQYVLAAGLWLVNAALSANPIVLVVVGLIALGAALVIAYKKSETFRAVVNAGFNAVKAVAGAVFGFIKSHWQMLAVILLLPIAPILLVVANFGKIKGAVSSVYNFVKGKIGALAGIVRGAGSAIGGAAAGMFNGIKTAFRSAINWVINAWNGLEFTLPKIDTHIPGVGTVGGGTFGTPDIPNVARGGIVRSRPGGTILRAGEARRREAIIPLPSGFDLSKMSGDTLVQVLLDGQVIEAAAVRVYKNEANGTARRVAGRSRR